MTVTLNVVGGAMRAGDQIHPFVADTGPAGDDGDAGANGWTPILAGVLDGVRTLLQIVDWTGGAGAKPAVGMYIGTTGYVAAKADAFNFNATKRVSIFSAVTNASGIATVLFAFSPALTTAPNIAFWGSPNVLAGPIKVEEVASSRTATQVQVKVSQAALLTGVITLLAGATVFVLAIES